MNKDCHIIQENYLSSNSIDDIFVQIYIMPLSDDFTNNSKCSIKINQVPNINVGSINQIYFKRKSIKAIIVFQQLDLMTQNHNFTFG